MADAESVAGDNTNVGTISKIDGNGNSKANKAATPVSRRSQRLERKREASGKTKGKAKEVVVKKESEDRSRVSPDPDETLSKKSRSDDGAEDDDGSDSDASSTSSNPVMVPTSKQIHIITPFIVTQFRIFWCPRNRASIKTGVVCTHLNIFLLISR